MQRVHLHQASGPNVGKNYGSGFVILHSGSSARVWLVARRLRKRLAAVKRIWTLRRPMVLKKAQQLVLLPAQAQRPEAKPAQQVQTLPIWKQPSIRHPLQRHRQNLHLVVHLCSRWRMMRRLLVVVLRLAVQGQPLPQLQQLRPHLLHLPQLLQTRSQVLENPYLKHRFITLGFQCQRHLRGPQSPE